MMSVPFFLFACALGAIWLERRAYSLGLWAAGVVTLLLLFQLHSTDALDIVL